CFALGELALLDFPGAVELTEGRDALKPTPAFSRLVKAFYQRLLRIGEEPHATPQSRQRLAELAAQISALMLQSTAWNEIAPELARRLLGPQRHLVSPDRAEAIIGFLGPKISERLFVPESFWAEREWHGYVPGERELLEDELAIDGPESLANLSRRRPDL